MHIQSFREAMVELKQVKFGKSTGHRPEKVLPRQVSGEKEGKAYLFNRAVGYLVDPTDMVVIYWPWLVRAVHFTDGRVTELEKRIAYD